MSRAILFDLDGVLIDSMDHHAKIWQQAILDKLGIELSKQYFLINEGKNSKDILDELIFKYQINSDENTWKRISDYRDELFLRDFHPRLMEGAKELVEMLSGFDYRLGVATGSTRLVAEEVLMKTGILPYFSTLVTSEDVQNSKPHPQPYQTLLQKLLASADQSLVIENAPLGIKSAKAAGLICIGVATTNSPEILYQADRVFVDLPKITEFLEVEFKTSNGIGLWAFENFLKEKN